MRKSIMKLTPILLILALLGGLLSGCAPEPEQGVLYGSKSKDLARGKKAFASSGAADSITDNNNATFVLLTRDEEGTWFYVDLGSSKNVNRVSVLWGAPEDAEGFPSSYAIQYSSDKESWLDAAEVTDGRPGSIDTVFPSVRGRYIRVNVTGSAGDVAVCAMRVYGTDASVRLEKAEGGSYRSGSLEVNLAEGKEGYASSGAKGGYTSTVKAKELTDSDTLTFFVSHAKDKNPWFVVDLGSRQDINKAVVYFGSDKDPYTATQPGAYDLQVSDDGESWITVRRVEDASYGKTVLIFGTLPARYVRVYVTDMWAGTDYVSMYEFKVFGTDFASAQPAGEPDPVRILFIGNSLTCYNNVASKVQSIFEAAGVRAEVDVLIRLGQPLLYHATLPETRQTILGGNYDYVVMQDKASGFSSEVLQAGAATLYHRYIKQTGAQPVLYMIWANQNVLEKTQDDVTNGYVETAQSIGARLAPAGVQWLYYSQKGENWYTDNIHANAIGSYMAAANIYYAITGEKTPLVFDSTDEVVAENGFDVDLVNDIHERACEYVLQYNL